MGIQASATQSTFPFILKGDPYVLSNQTILRDASRVSTTNLAAYTVMAQIASTAKWVPFTSLSASDGTAFPLGILMAVDGISAASIIAADVTNVPILVGGSRLVVDGSQLVFDTGYNSGVSALTLASIVVGNAAGSGTATPYFTMTVQRWLESRGIFIQTTTSFDATEN